MKSGKKILVVIMILLFLLLSVVGAFAYIYLATDILKTDKELFLTYFSQVVSEDGFIDQRIIQFNEKKRQTPYEDSGELTVEIEYPDESMDTVIDKVNDLSIRYSGKVDSQNQKVEQNIKVDYGNDVIFPLNYRQEGNKLGLQTDELSKKYIAIRNEKLDELVEKANGENIISISERVLNFIETLTLPNNMIQGIKFSEDEKNQLKQIYGTILEQYLLEDKFSSVKAEQNESYILEISFGEIKNIIIKMLEETKENTLIIDKLNGLALQIDSTLEKIDTSDIDEIIEKINQQDVSEISNLKIILVQSSKQLNQIIIENEETKIVIDKKLASDSLKYNTSCEIKEDKNIEESTSIDSLLAIDNSTSIRVNAYFNVEYTGLENLSDVQENYEIGFSVIEGERKMKYDYIVNSNTKFAESVLIENLDESVAIFLNDYEETQLTPFLAQVGTRILTINKNQMAKLGLKEIENPLLYSNPITMLGITIYSMASDIRWN